LDNFPDFARIVAFGIAHLLHHGWVHPHPVGFSHHCSRNQARSGSKTCVIAGCTHETGQLGWNFVDRLGVLALAYQGINHTREKKVLDVGPKHITTETHERIPIPAILGGLALARRGRTVAELIQTHAAHATDHERESAPVWIPRNGKDSHGIPYVVLTCTDCLRSFPLSVMTEDLQKIQETSCVFCPNTVRYIIDFSLSIASPRPEVDARGPVIGGRKKEVAG